MSISNDDKRAESKARMLQIAEDAYDQKLITKIHEHGEIVYKIHVPHEKIELYSLVSDHNV